MWSKLKGHVPSLEYRKTILGIVKANMAELTVDDRMKQADGSPAPDLWLGAVSFALNQLGRLKDGGKARLEDTTLTLSGEARSAADYRQVKLALTSRLPRGLELKQNTVTPPIAKPFNWRAEFRSGAPGVERVRSQRPGTRRCHYSCQAVLSRTKRR